MSVGYVPQKRRRLAFGWLVNYVAACRRRRAMIDLMHASPHLLQDIGMSERDGYRRRGP